jgi:hypothetical protein
MDQSEIDAADTRLSGSSDRTACLRGGRLDDAGASWHVADDVEIRACPTAIE